MPEITVAVAGAVSTVIYYVLARVGDLRGRFGLFVVLFAAAFALYLLALHLAPRLGSGRRAMQLVLIPALVARLILLAFGEPTLSTDIYRYVWDGQVLLAGENPYQFAPASPERSRFQTLAVRVNHPEISTIYPPLAEVTFAAATWFHPGERAVRVVLVLGDLLVVWGLAAWLRARGRPVALCLAWAWCPLVLIETALSGHLDALAIGLLIVGLQHLQSGRRNLSTMFLLGSALVKLFALAVAIACARRLGPGRLLVLFAAFFVAWLPFRDAGPGMWRGLAAYGGRWQANAPLFSGVVGALESIGSAEHLKRGIAWLQPRLGGPGWMDRWYKHVYPQEVSRALVVLAFLGVVSALAFREVEPMRAGGLLVLVFLLLTPTLHPWYVLWGVAFWPALRGRALLALAALVPLSYSAAAHEWRTGVWHEQPLFTVLEFAPFAVLLWRDLRAGRFRLQEALPC